jgi:hypothetical protein
MITASSTAAVGTMPVRGAAIAQSFAQTEQSSVAPDKVGLDTLRQHEQRAIEQRQQRADLEGISSDGQETSKWQTLHPSKAGQALALPQAKEGGYGELLAQQQPVNWALQAS